MSAKRRALQPPAANAARRLPAAPARGKSAARYRHAYVVAALVVAVIAIYWQVLHHNFIWFDDDQYITENTFIASGVSPQSLAWAFTTIYAANWHPLTWISHMIDVQVFGLNPGAHHAVNLGLHAANSALLFVVLARLTGTFWRSALVAALFAVHPLHVESVAWISERKDLLSTLLGLVTLLLYQRYTVRRELTIYVCMFISFSASLMAKPMLVTLPILLLLLDYWPLARTGGSPTGRSLRPLLMEKLPLLVPVAVSSFMTLRAQQQAEAISSLGALPLGARIANALGAYVAYLSKMLWPLQLSIFYPLPAAIPFWKSCGSAVLIGAITVLCVRERTRRPYLITGWLWYLLTLVPVIGIVKVGLQAMADRFTYVPLTGIFIMLAWGLAECASSRVGKRVVVTATAGGLGLLAVMSWTQLHYWRDTYSLFGRALELDPQNSSAMLVLGNAHYKDGHYAQALELAERAMAVSPWLPRVNYSRGAALHRLGRIDEAVKYYNVELSRYPGNVGCRNNLGIALAERGEYAEAVRQFTQVIRERPEYPQARKNLEKALRMQGTVESPPG